MRSGLDGLDRGVIGPVRTLDPARPVAPGLTVHGGRVAALEPPPRGAGCRLPPGAVVVPGFEDPHLHLLAMAAARLSVDAGPAAAPDLAALGRVLAAGAAERPEVAWLRATGFDDALVAERRLPGAALLDAAAGRRPLVVHHAAGRVVLLNTAARCRLGVDGDGVLDSRDPRLAAVPPLGPAELAAGLGAVRDALLAAGVVAVTDATATNGRAEVELLDGFAATALAPLEVTVLPSARALGDLGGARPGSRLGTARLGPAAKVVVEGDEPGDLHALIAAARRDGWPVALHVTDVDGVDRALGALRAVPALPPGRRDRLEHLSLCLPEQVAQVAASGAAVVTQPAFLHARGAKYAEQLGEVERAWLYRVRSLLDAGVTVAASSDAPVVDASPLASMAAAVDRRGLAPGEAVDAATALDLVTRSAAAVSGTGGGVLRAGGPAAFVVLDADPCRVGAEEVRVLATVAARPGAPAV